jgi:AAA ATPase domain
MRRGTYSLVGMHPDPSKGSAAGVARLLERDKEFLAIDDAIRAASAGDGTAVVLEGPAGIGKTSLLDAARRRAIEAGMTVVASHGAFLESDFAFGVVRQLFTPVIAGASASERRHLLEGAAALAKPVVAPEEVGPGTPPSHPTAVAHGLYWLTANLAERTPVVIAVDDVQWSDPPSLRFLAYLSRRLEGMTALLLVAVRTGDPQVDASLVAELVAGPGVRVIRPTPLTLYGVGEFVRARLGSAEGTFIEACRTATGGVPFLLEELLGTLEADGVKPTREAAGLIERSGPRTVAQATLLRLGRLSAEAVAVARAIAVLGRQARLDRVAALADVDLDPTGVAVDALIAMDLLAPDHPMRFVHPLVHQAIYEDLHPTARAAAHARVARLLTEEDAALDEVAAHLLLSEPTGRDDVVETLRRAADAALRRGAPQSAAAYLRRAGSEGGEPLGSPCSTSWGKPKRWPGICAGSTTSARRSRSPTTRPFESASPTSWRPCTPCRGIGAALPTAFGTPWPSRRNSTSISWRTSKPPVAPSSSSIRGPHTSSRSDFHACSP